MNKNLSSGVFKEFIYAFHLQKEQQRMHPWETEYTLSPTEHAIVSKSIQQFQLGEGSDGSGFLRRANQFAERGNDSSYPEAVKLFIGEEQHHSELLGRFLQREGISVLSSHWVDWCFRRLRRLAGAETAATVLVTAELIARPYYRALRGATHSPLLKSICHQILQEEEIHIEFQATAIALLSLHRPNFLRAFSRALHRALMKLTCVVAWESHKEVFMAGNYTFNEFYRECEEGIKSFHALVNQQIVNLSKRFEGKEMLSTIYHIEEVQNGKLA